MDKWDIVNKFREIVAEGKAGPITCPDCKHNTVFLIGENDEPLIFCPWDGNKYDPGLTFWSDMKAIASEHYV